jgi:fluoroacetyl-CoA thioesterase
VRTLVGVTTLRFIVTDADTATALGSGDVPVLATPRLLAWMEAATVAAAAGRLDATSTSVGVEVALRHRRASKVGALVEVEVTEVAEQDRGLSFTVLAREVPPGGADAEGGDGADLTAAPSGPVIASGRVVRAVVDRQAFLARL